MHDRLINSIPLDKSLRILFFKFQKMLLKARYAYARINIVAKANGDGGNCWSIIVQLLLQETVSTQPRLAAGRST